MKKVLIPIDWSENAEKAFDWYIYNLHQKGVHVFITHFIEASKEKDLQEKEMKLMELQEVYETRLLQMKIDYTWLTGNSGSPGEFIIKVAKEEDADMIIMGARGLGKLKKTILGSVSDHVLNKSKVPVLIFKGL
jgi:nucleotide-binding universal stress UspA family protein